MEDFAGVTAEFTVPEEEDGSRLDAFVAKSVEGLTRSAAQRLAAEGLISVNGRTADKSLRLRKGQSCIVVLPEPREADIVPEDIPLDVVYEDGDVIVINKPRGMVVHPAPGNYGGTLVNALMYRFGDRLSGINGVIRPGIVHRIDKDTSGLLVVAANDEAHLCLAEQIKAHSMHREYRAVNVGHFREPEGTVNVPIGRSASDRKKQAVFGLNAREAVTHYRTLLEFDGYSYCMFRLETGRTHQIRVHSAHLGHPVAGDTVYGGARNDLGLAGQCLHAAILGFRHPRTGEFMDFTAPLPDYFTKFISKIDKENVFDYENFL